MRTRSSITHRQTTFRLLAALALVYAYGGCATTPEVRLTPASVQDDVREALRSADTVDVIVNFRETVGPDASAEQRRLSIREARERVLHAASKEFVLTREFNDVPAVAGRVSRSGLELLVKEPLVLSVQLDERGHGAAR